MPLDKSRVVTEVMSTLTTSGFKPQAVEFNGTGKSATEIIIDAVATAIINELTENGVIKVKLDTSLNSIFANATPVLQDGGTSLQVQFIASTNGGIADNSTGTIE